MFGFGKKKKEEKKQSHLDKIILGAIIGGAIGSVVGVGLAPQKGVDTRKKIASKTSRLFGGFREKLKKIFRKKNAPINQDSHQKANLDLEDIKKIPHEN